ncbi:hypothetical protein [Croceicoccus sediminis]|uniref:hypothetical protein n=1 Tax=Croceicoccus sediminis TaxID=2571150 RepID=UPI001184256E|nr:hypothetical protein [Croceicoccus sediminis]
MFTITAAALLLVAPGPQISAKSDTPSRIKADVAASMRPVSVFAEGDMRQRPYNRREAQELPVLAREEAQRPQRVRPLTEEAASVQQASYLTNTIYSNVR